MSQLRYRGPQRQGSVPQGVNHSSGYFRQTEQETTPFIISTKEDAVTATLPVRAVARDGDDQACGDDAHDPDDATVSSRFAFGSILGGFGALYSNILHIKREASKAAKSAELKRQLRPLVSEKQYFNARKERRELLKATLEGYKESQQAQTAWLEADKQELETKNRSLVVTKGSLDAFEKMSIQMEHLDGCIARRHAYIEELDEDITAAKKEIESLIIRINALEKAINGIKSDLSLISTSIGNGKISMMVAMALCNQRCWEMTGR